MRDIESVQGVPLIVFVYSRVSGPVGARSALPRQLQSAESAPRSIY